MNVLLTDQSVYNHHEQSDHKYHHLKSNHIYLIDNAISFRLPYYTAKRMDIMIADRIKQLRTSNNITQVALAKKLNITRSSVNAWEMGISIPSTTYIVELSQLFKVSTDYLLGLSSNTTLDVSMLSDKEIQIIFKK